MKYNSLESLESLLTAIKSLQKQDLDQQFYDLMTNAKQLLGDTHFAMAKFYYQYGSYLLSKIQQNTDIFGNAKQNPEVRQDQQAQQSQSEEDQNKDNQKNQHVTFQNQHLVITDGNQQKIQKKILDQQIQNNNNQQANQQKKQQVQDDDQICYQNLSSSLNIYMNQNRLYSQGQKLLAQHQVQTLLRNIAKVRSRLGDFYYVKQNFNEAIQIYRQALNIYLKLNNYKTQRKVAQIYFMIGNCYVLKNDPNCQLDAIAEYIQAINILVAHMCLYTQFKNFDVPTKQKLKVDRLYYLPQFSDTQYVKELKGVINCLLDKLQDTHYQFEEKQVVMKMKQEQQRKKKQQQQKLFFKSTDPNTPIVKLGTFGNANTTILGNTIIRRKIPPLSNNQQFEHTNKKIINNQSQEKKQQKQ